MREDIIKLRETGATYKEIARIMGVSRTAIRHRLLGQPYKAHRKEPTPCQYCGKQVNGKRVSSFCNQKCHADWEYTYYIQRWKCSEKSGNKSSGENLSGHIRRYIFEKYGGVCCKCGWCKQNVFTKKVPLQINHIDGNSRNSKEDNLELLCPNCHTLTENYGSRNKGNGRKSRYFLKFGGSEAS